MPRALYSARMTRAVLIVACVLWIATAQGARAQTQEPAADSGPAPESGAQPAADAPAGQSTLDLDSLLRPRGDFQGSRKPPKQELRGGRDRLEWHEVFSEAQLEVSELEGRVAELQEAVRAASGGEWNFSPVGGGVPSDPEVLKLRAQLKRDRQSLEAAEARLRDLEVEASLASVPDSWRGTGNDE